MATIPSDQKFHTLNANTPTKDRGSSQTDGLREIYTMQDIIDTAGGGGGTAGIDLSLIVRETAYGSIGDHEGTVLTIGPVSALAQVHRWDGTGWTLANGSSVANSIGLLCLGTAASGDALVKGIMQLGAVPGSAGDVLYMSTTNGLLTNDISGFTQGQVVRVCGYNLGSNKVYFNPSPDWIEIA